MVKAVLLLKGQQTASVFTVIDTLAPNSTQYSDTGLTPETTYYYRIRSFNDTTGSDYAWSEGNTTFKAGALPGKAIPVYPADDAPGYAGYRRYASMGTRQLYTFL